MPIDKRLFQRNRPARTLLILAVGAGFLAAALLAAQTWFLSGAVDRVFLQRQMLRDVSPLLALMLVVIVLRGAAIWLGDVLAQRSASRVKGRVRQQLTAHVFALGPAYTRAERSGDLVSTMIEGVEALDEYIVQFLPARYLAGIAPAFIFLLIFLIDPPTTLVLLLAGPLLILLLALIGGRAKKLTERRFVEMRWMSAFFLDVLQGIATLKAFGRSKEQASAIEDISRHYGNTTMEVLATAFQTSLVMEWSATAATALVALEVSLRLMGGTLPFHQALAVLLLTPEFFMPLRQLALKYHAGATGKAAAQRIFAILDTLPQGRSALPNTRITDHSSRIAHPNAEALPSGTSNGKAASSGAPFDTKDARKGRSAFSIRFRDVSFAYENGQRPALQGFSLTIPHGQTVALVGPTGAGKTTVVNLLLRFIEPDSGAIMVDDAPLGHIERAEWISQVAWVSQLPHLFHGTIADNLRLARPNASLAEIIAAARAAHAHEFIETFSKGYDTPLGEGGVRLSGGQRQRIAIARAFLKDAPMLILDEATSHLDARSEVLIKDALARLMKGRTVLIIAHRLDLAYAADQVVVMDQGRAVESGDHATLLQRDGLYSRLVAAYESGYSEVEASAGFAG